MRTSRENIYAVGDVTGWNMVMNLAVLQGEVAGENASGGRRAINASVLPQAVFTDPQYAKVGLSRRQCQEQGLDLAEAPTTWPIWARPAPTPPSRWAS